jgi:hypothetical protein
VPVLMGNCRKQKRFPSQLPSSGRAINIHLAGLRMKTWDVDTVKTPKIRSFNGESEVLNPTRSWCLWRWDRQEILPANTNWGGWMRNIVFGEIMVSWWTLTGKWKSFQTIPCLYQTFSFAICNPPVAGAFNEWSFSARARNESGSTHFCRFLVAEVKCLRRSEKQRNCSVMIADDSILGCLNKHKEICMRFAVPRKVWVSNQCSRLCIVHIGG